VALPSFLIIGAQKAATTTLWAQLRTHPDIFMPDLKETNFFIDHRCRMLGLPWYESLFEPARPGQLVGEASPAYTLFPLWGQVPSQVSEVLPDVKLVYVLRDPVERMRSSWIQARSDGLELLALKEALTRNLLYQAGSSYALQTEQYLKHFDRDQLLFLLAEDVAERPGETLDALLTFLGLDPGWRPASSERLNVSAGKRILRQRGDLAARALARAGRQSASEHVRQAALRGGAWNMLSRELRPEELVIDDELRDRLHRALEPDLRRLVPLLGTATDPWGVLDTL
jgi:hypothetical protein